MQCSCFIGVKTSRHCACTIRITPTKKVNMDDERPYHDTEEHRPKNTNYGVCTFWCLMMLLLVIAGLVFAIVYLTLIGPNSEAEEVVPVTTQQNNECNNPACLSLGRTKLVEQKRSLAEYANSLIQTMDSSVEPCNDFYDYACGNWIKNTIVPEGYDQVTTAYSEKDRQQDLRVLLEAPSKPDEPAAVTKARTFYDSCMDRDTREANGVNVVNGGVQGAFGGWPILESNPGGGFIAENFDLTAILTGLFVYAGSTSIARADARYHEDSNTYKLEISAGKFSTMPNIEHLVDNRYQKEQKAVIDYMTDAALILGANPAIARQEMAAVNNLETRLAEAYLNNSPTPDNVMTVGELQDMYPAVNWTVFLTTLIPETVAIITDDFEVINVDGDYLTEVFGILEGEPPRLIADWMLWLCYHDAHAWLNDEMRNTLYDFLAIVEGTPKPEYYQDCTDLVHNLLPGATARLFADANIPTETQSMLDTITENVRTMFSSLIDESSSFAAKEAAKSKVNEALVNVGVPDYIHDNEILDQEYENLNYAAEGTDIFQNFLGVLSYRIQRNVALMNADNSEEDVERLMAWQTPSDIGLSQSPFFNKDWPSVLNYGTLGFHVANTLALATPTDNKGEIGSCLRDQYGKFTLPENGRTPLGDEANIIADNAGLQVASEYIKSQLALGDEFTLAGLDLSEEQLFFLTNAQLWCEKYSDDYVDEFEGETPGRFRVEGMMQNSEAFSDAFMCSSEDRMNPSDKCVVL